MRMPGVKKPRLCRIAIHSEIKEIGTNLTASGARYKRNSFEAGFGNLLDSIVPSVAATVKNCRVRARTLPSDRPVGGTEESDCR